MDVKKLWPLQITDYNKDEDENDPQKTNKENELHEFEMAITNKLASTRVENETLKTG